MIKLFCGKKLRKELDEKNLLLRTWLNGAPIHQNLNGFQRDMPKGELLQILSNIRLCSVQNLKYSNTIPDSVKQPIDIITCHYIIVYLHISAINWF